MNIVLCGMMGVGKTSVGKKLEFLTQKKCVDTDRIIVEKYGNIADIFEKHGEAYFRDLETQVAKELSLQDGLIIATGGGFVLREENVEYLKKNGKIVLLQAKLDTLVERVSGNDERPLLKDGAKKALSQLLQKRLPVYQSVADYVVDTDGKTVVGIAEEIISYLDGERK